MCFKNKIFLKVIFLCIGIGLAISDTRECSPNFISNPQFPSSGPECLPEQFLYYSSTSISYYYFIESILNDINLSDEDWVGAFSCEQWEDNLCVQLGPCVGARQWGACSNNGGCDIPVFGDDGSSLTSGYMNYNEIPIFKIYNFSNNLYIEAQSSDEIPWEYLSNPIINQLSAYDDIVGCTDINATNYNMYATINDGSCTLQDSECLFDINAIDINPSNYEFNGSVTCSIVMDGESVGSENDYLIAYYDNEPRGIVNGLYFPVTTSYVYNLMLYSNSTNGETFSFKYYKASTGETFCLDESINFESDMYIGNAFSPFIIDINLSDTISGCLDPNAINYNPNATIDNDSCLYPEDMVPELFEFNQSTAQAFYFINNILIDGVEISSEDWVGAFNNDLCVGARKWETDLCNNQICEVPIMGDDGEDYSMGYMNAGEIPIFKIYDYSEGVYYDATPSVSEPWYNLSSIILDSLIVTIDVEGCTDEIACNYDSNATADNGTCYYSENNFNCDGDCIVNIDCEGVCGGFAIEDECGVCNGNGILEGECDCSGNVVDCNGECGGVAIEDECGICGGPGSVFDCGCYNIPEEFCDCNESVYDECGICGGPGLNEYGCCENEIQDCNGLCGGSAVLDECGVCDSNSLNDCNQDCLDIWGGDAIYDDCGVCNGNNENIDCEGNCFGTVVLDECGECGGDGSICNAPIAYNQTIETQEDILINFTVDSSDPNNDNLEIQILSNPIHGLLEINDLNITYYPNENYSGTDNIIYKTSDGVWSSNEAQITIIVSELLDAPIISDITVEVYEDQSISIDLGAYDTDSDDDSLEFNIVNGPNYGTLTENRANASYTYIPNLDYNGNDEFIYEVSDGISSSQASVFINIINTNDLPLANDFDFTNLEIIDFSNYISDIDGDDLEIRTIPPSTETNLITIFGNELIYSGSDYIYSYIPNGNFDVLLYKVDDGLSVSNVATAIYDTSGEGFNRDTPSALDDEINMEEDNQIVVSFFGFDYDGFFNGSPSIEIIQQPINGVLGEISEPEISGFIAEWTALYVPNEDYFGNDLITFSVTDDNGEVSEIDGVISISINPINDAPILEASGNVQFNEDETEYIENYVFASDIDGDYLIYNLSGGSDITANLNDGDMSFSATENFNGTETFTISVTDGLLTDSEVITVTVNPVNDSPILLTDLSNINFDEDTSLSMQLYANDIDGDDLIFGISGYENITATISNSNITFIAPSNYNGVEAFSITVSDGELLDSEDFFVTVNSINDSPNILSTSPSEINVSIGYQYNIEVIDVDGDNLIFSLIGAPNNMTISNNGLVVWNDISPDLSFVDFVISVSDGLLSDYENINLNIIQFYDCNGVANGPAIEDCAGECGGNAIEDECGICNGDNSLCTGCMNENACNYDSLAIISDNSTCEFPEQFFDCEGQCIVDIDCFGLCGGLAELDECGICNGDGIVDGLCDCDGNILDCNGDCGGPAIVDECGECGGDGTSCLECDSDPSTWIVNPPDFEFNGSITASVIMNDEYIGSEQDILAGFVNNEIRGAISGLLFPPTNGIVFNLMLFSNEAIGEIIDFKYYHAASDQVFCLSETIEFQSDMIIGNALAPFEFNINEDFILGCTDTAACNYNPESNFNDGSCEYAENNYDCNGECLNDSDGDFICDESDPCEGTSNEDLDNDGLCNELDICIGFENIDDDGDGICNDYDPCFGFDNVDADGDGLCDDQEVAGCPDENACNYDPDATDEGDCIYAEEYYDCNGLCLNDSDADEVCDELEIIGCLDNQACNFNPAATDEGECEYPEENFDCNDNCIVDIDCNGECGGDAFIDQCDQCVSGNINPDDCLSNEINIPNEIYLSQNYPNPFNPITFIDYGVNETENIKIILYDISGKEIKKLVNRIHTPGNYNLTITSENLNSGIYLVQLISLNSVITKKIVLIK